MSGADVAFWGLVVVMVIVWLAFPFFVVLRLGRIIELMESARVDTKVVRPLVPSTNPAVLARRARLGQDA